MEQQSTYDFVVQDMNGAEVSLDTYRGKALLIVNTASKCGFTPQYEGLQRLHQVHGDSGLQILAFPCDQFGHQEPGDNEEIQSFCRLNYGVTFPVMGKVDVNGRSAAPLFVFLKKRLPGTLGGRIPWNFTKFLVDRSGVPVKRYAPQVSPDAIEPDIRSLLSTEARQ